MVSSELSWGRFRSLLTDTGEKLRADGGRCQMISWRRRCFAMKQRQEQILAVAALCEEKWRLRRGGRHWSGWGRDDMWQKGVKGAVGRKKRGLKEHGKSADHYNCLFSLWLRYSMSLLTKLPPEVLEQVSHIFRFNQLSQNISRYKTQNRSQSLIVLLPILWDG